MEKKYIPLNIFFQNLQSNEITLSFKEIENIMGQQLPNTAYLNSSWWKKSKRPFTHFEAWALAGYHVKSVIIGTEVTFSNSSYGNAEESERKHSIIVREIELVDSKHLIKLKQAIYSKNLYEYYEPNQFDITVQSLKKHITNLKKSDCGTILISVFNGHIVGFVEVTRTPSSRLQHIAQLHIGIHPQFEVLEIGTTLINASINWAVDKDVTKLEVKAVPDNEKLISLYQLFNFSIEGKRKNALLIDNHFIHELYLGKFLNEEENERTQVLTTLTE